jgi:hypothetical protein
MTMYIEIWMEVKKYYCPNGVITNNFPSKNICISPEDI